MGLHGNAMHMPMPVELRKMLAHDLDDKHIYEVVRIRNSPRVWTCSKAGAMQVQCRCTMCAVHTKAFRVCDPRRECTRLWLGCT